MFPALAVSGQNQLRSNWGNSGTNIRDWHTMPETGKTILYMQRGAGLTGNNPQGNPYLVSINKDVTGIENIKLLQIYSQLEDHITVMGSGPYSFAAVWWNDAASTNFIEWSQTESPNSLAANVSPTGVVKIADSTGLNFAQHSEPNPTNTDFFGVRQDESNRWEIAGGNSYMGLTGSGASADSSKYQVNYSATETIRMSKLIARNFISLPNMYVNFALYGY